MQSQFIRKTTFLVAVLVAISFCLIDAMGPTFSCLKACPPKK